MGLVRQECADDWPGPAGEIGRQVIKSALCRPDQQSGAGFVGFDDIP